MADVLFVLVTDGVEYHHGMARVSAVLKQHGHSTALFVFHLLRDCEALRAEFEETLRRERPLLVAASVISGHWDIVRQKLPICGQLTDAPVLLGGWHPTLAADDVLADANVDYVCVGEGEGPTLDLVTALKAGTDPRSIQNIWGRDDGAVFRNALRAPNKDLDALPFPDWALFDYADALDRNVMTILGVEGPPRIAGITAGRGCPHRCAYCGNAAWHQRYGLKPQTFVRRRGVSRVLDEIEALNTAYNPSWFEFWDEDFMLDQPWLDAFCREYPGRSSRYFAIMAHPNRARPDRLKRLADAGCRLMYMGVETGDESYRRRYLNRNLKDRDLLRAFRGARDAGIATVSFTMIGMPFETRASLEKTLDFNRLLDPDFFLFVSYIPYPNTELYRMAEEAGLLPPTLPLNLGVHDAPNVSGLDPADFREMADEMAELKQACDAARERRFPGFFGLKADPELRHGSS